MSAGSAQLAAKGIQDEYLTGSPQMSFFYTMFTKHSPFIVKVHEIPFNESRITFGSSQVCDISKAGDVIRSITVKVTLPSMFQSGTGLAYPAAIKSPGFYYLDSGFQVVSSYFARNIKSFFSTNDTNWLPSAASTDQNTFMFSGSASYIGFTDTQSALFWGFKNYINYVNGFYIWNFTNVSELTLFASGWIPANSNYLRYYKPSATLALIQSVELYIGGQLIESITSEYLQIWNDLNYENAQQLSVSHLTGTRLTPSTKDVDYYVKVPFSLENIPAAALSNQTIEVKLNIGNYQDILDANAFNITNFSVTSCPAVTGIGGGVYDYVATSNSLVMYQGNTIVNIVAVSGITGLATDTINVFAISGSNIIQYQPSSNIATVTNICQTVGLCDSTCMVGGLTGLYTYTNQSAFKSVVNNQLRSYEFPYQNPYLATVYNNQAFVACGNSVVVQNLSTPYISTRYNSLYGAAVQLSSGPYGMFYSTANALVAWNGNGFSLSTSLTSAPTCMLTTPTNTLLFYANSVIIVSNYTQTLQVNFSALAAQYISGTTVFISNSYGGLALWNWLGANPSWNRTTNTFPYIFSGASNIYAVDSNSTIWQFTSFATQPVLVPTTFAGSPIQFAMDTTLNRAYFKTNNSPIYYINDGTDARLYPFTPTYQVVSGLNSLFFDGQYVYSFPADGTSAAYKLNTFSDFRSNASHYITTAKTYAGAVAFDGRYIMVTPLAQDSNITMYDTTLPFIEPSAFSVYSGLLEGNYDYNSVALYKNDIFIGSNSQVVQFQISPESNLTTSTISNSFNFASFTDGTTVFVFNGNLQANGYSAYDILSGSVSTSNNAFLNYPGIYGTAVKRNSDIIMLVPKNNSNLLVFSMSTRSVSSLTLPSFNGSNTACIVGNNLYIFPDLSQSFYMVYNLLTYSGTTNYGSTRFNYQSSTYDGSKYIYLTDPTGNVVRLNTTTDTFNDGTSWTTTNPSIRVNYPARTVQISGNALFVASQNVFSINTSASQTRTYSNIFALGVSSAVIDRQPMMNSLYFVSTNIYRYNGTSNLTTAFLPSQRTVADVTCGASNVYISFTDGTLGTLDTTSNDANSIYYYKSLSTNIIASNLTNSVIVGSNVYFVTSNNISRISLTSNAETNVPLAAPGTYANVFSTVVAVNNNVYVFGSNSNLITKVSDSLSLSIIERNRWKGSNIGCATVNGSYIYAFSKFSNTGVSINYNTSLALSTAIQSVQMNTVSATAFSPNGFSCCFVYSSNLYMLPYGGNIVASYSLPTLNFSNTFDATSNSLSPISNVVSSTNTWVVNQTGYISNGTGYVPLIDIITGKNGYQYAQAQSNLYGFYNGAGYGPLSPSSGPIQTVSNAFITTFMIHPIYADFYSTGLFAAWISQTPVTVFDYANASVTNHSWFSLTFNFTAPSGYTVSPSSTSINGICTSAADCVQPIQTVSILQNGLVVSQVTPFITYQGDTLSIIVYSSGLACTVSGSLGSATVNISAPANQSILYTLSNANSYFQPKSFTSTSGEWYYVYIFSESGTISTSQDYYSATGNLSPLITSFAGTWLATNDGSTIVNATDSGNLTINPQKYSGYVYDSVFLAGSNVFIVNTYSHSTVQKYDTVANTSNTFVYPYTPIVNINYSAPYTYVLTDDGTTTLGILDSNNSLIATIPHSNLVSARISIPLEDGMLYVQSNTFSNITGVSVSRCKSVDYASLPAYTGTTQYSCVITTNGMYYLTPANGSTILQISARQVSQVTSQYIKDFDVRTIPGMNGILFVGNYNIVPTLDQFSNIVFTCTWTYLGGYISFCNVATYDTTSDFSTLASWKMVQYRFINNPNTVSVYRSGYQYVYSNVDSNLFQIPILGYPPSYYTYRHSYRSIAANVCTVNGSMAYMYPSVAGSNIIAFSAESKAFSTIGHDQIVLAVANVYPYTVIVNPTKINVFYTSNMTSLTAIPYSSTASANASVFYDGRYLNVMTPTGTAIFDFNKLGQVVTGPAIIGRQVQALNGNLYTANALLGYSPRPYTETSLTSPALGLYYYDSNLYGTVGGVVQNITTGSNLANITTTVDTLINNNKMYVLSSGFITTINVYSPNPVVVQIPTEYASQLTSDGTYLYIASNKSLNVLSMNTLTYQISISQNTLTATYTSQFFDQSNVVFITSQNQAITYRPGSSPVVSVAILPDRLQNNYASILVGKYIYYFPGNQNSNIVQIYNTSLPYNLSSSYSNVFIGNNDIRSLALNGSVIVGAPYTTPNVVFFDTSTKLVNNYPISNVALNGYSIVNANQNYVLTPEIGVTLQIISPRILSSNSVVSTVNFFPESKLASLVTYDKTMLIVTTSNVYSFDMTNPPIIIDKRSSIYSAKMYPSTAYYDGRFVKIIANGIVVYDTLPLTIPTTISMSCLVRAAYVGSMERKWMQNTTLDYVFTQVQTSNINMTSQSGYYKLYLTGPTTEILCTSSTALQSVEFFVNGYSKSLLDVNYLSNLAPYWYYPSVPSSNVYIIPFEPYINMSRVKEQVIFISGAPGSVNMYSKSLNVLRVKDGLGGVVFR